jgi:hypothetical protein
MTRSAWIRAALAALIVGAPVVAGVASPGSGSASGHERARTGSDPSAASWCSASSHAPAPRQPAAPALSAESPLCSRTVALAVFPHRQRLAGRGLLGISDRRSEVPAGWQLVEANLAVRSDQPQRFAAATFRVHRRGIRDCVDSTLYRGDGRLDDACLPWAGAIQTPNDGAFIYVAERPGVPSRALHATARPARFRYAAARVGGTCAGARTAFAFAFVDHHRVYQAMLLIGSKATPRTRTDALTVLDHLRLRPR